MPLIQHLKLFVTAVFVCLWLFMLVLNPKNVSAMTRQLLDAVESTDIAQEWSILHHNLFIVKLKDCKHHWKCELMPFFMLLLGDSTDSPRMQTDQSYTDRPVFNSYFCHRMPFCVLHYQSLTWQSFQQYPTTLQQTHVLVALFTQPSALKIATSFKSFAFLGTERLLLPLQVFKHHFDAQDFLKHW